jgi:hypothetical protein
MIPSLKEIGVTLLASAGIFAAVMGQFFRFSSLQKTSQHFFPMASFIFIPVIRSADLLKETIFHSFVNSECSFNAAVKNSF